MLDRQIRAEHPTVAVASLDRHTGLVRGDDVCLAQRRQGSAQPGPETTLGATKLVHQPALAKGEPEQVRQGHLQPWSEGRALKTFRNFVWGGGLKIRPPWRW